MFATYVLYVGMQARRARSELLEGSSSCYTVRLGSLVCGIGYLENILKPR
jgi:hypothetical protein